MNGKSKNCVLIFVKYPVAGNVKTRLAECIGEDVSAELYRNFVTDILVKLEALDVDLKIVYDPPEYKEKFQDWLGREHSYIRQAGENLGQRMKNAFLRAFDQGYERVVVIGSDSPDLPVEYIDLAFRALDHNDIVIGPTGDGGYYLMAFVRGSFLPEVFETVSWSTGGVFKQTVDILKKHGQIVYLLGQWHDVDTPEDLRSFLRRNENSAFSGSQTMCYMIKHKLGDKINV